VARSRPDLLRGFRTSLTTARRGLAWLRARAGTVMTALVVGCGLALLGSGIPLIWHYEPAGTSQVGAIHEGSGYLLIILSFVIAVRAGLARLRRRSGHLGWIAALGLLALLLAAGTSGVAIGWNEIRTPSHAVYGDPATGETQVAVWPAELRDPPWAPEVEPERLTGILAATQDGVVRIVSDGAPVSQTEYVALSWAHLAVLPILAATTYAGGRWLTLRRLSGADRPEGKDSGPGTTNADPTESEVDHDDPGTDPTASPSPDGTNDGRPDVTSGKNGKTRTDTTSDDNTADSTAL
jgi:hypothetical protein